MDMRWWNDENACVHLCFPWPAFSVYFVHFTSVSFLFWDMIKRWIGHAQMFVQRLWLLFHPLLLHNGFRPFCHVNISFYQHIKSPQAKIRSIYLELRIAWTINLVQHTQLKNTWPTAPAGHMFQYFCLPKMWVIWDKRCPLLCYLTHM